MPAFLGRIAAVGAAALVFAGAARSEPVAVLVVPPFPLERFADRGAVGLMTPGAGTTVTHKGAVAALVRGKVAKSLLGGVPGGKPKIMIAQRPAATTIYVSLPPAGTHANTRRYPVAVVGSGYSGILDSKSTHITGLVSIADIAPTAIALAEGKKRPVGWKPGTAADVRALDRRMDRQQRARDPAVAILALSALALALAALALSSLPLARACLLAAPLALALSVVFSGAGLTRPAALLPALALLTIALSVLGGLLLDVRGLAAVFLCLIAGYLVVLVAKPTWAALAAIGPNPGEGGRFYGSTNLTTSVVLTVALFAAGAFGLRSVVPIALLTLVAVGWSRAGADGGGIVVVVAAFAALGVRLATGRLTVRAVAAAAGLSVAFGLALVGADAATGGSSHVTKRVGDGPGALLGELGSRLHISFERLVTSWHAALVFAVSIAALAMLASRPPRFAVGDALLVGIGASLLVNDTPQHVAAAGAISYGVLWVHERVGVAATRPPG
jgi:hypothetical protein